MEDTEKESREWLKQKIEKKRTFKQMKEAKLLEKLEKRKAAQETKAAADQESAVLKPKKPKRKKKHAVQPVNGTQDDTTDNAVEPKLTKVQKKQLKKDKKQKMREEGVEIDEKTKQKILRRLKEAEKKCRVSIAVPGSILDNTQSLELRTYVAGQIARAAAIYKIDEIVVYSDKPVNEEEANGEEEEEEFKGLRHGKAGVHLSRVLQYLECPQYLRRSLFPVHVDLKYAGLLNPLDAPHHLRRNEVFRFREGVATKNPCQDGTYIDVGLEKPVKVNMRLLPGTRVTVELDDSCKPEIGGGVGRLVSPRTPREVTGTYWGYEVRYEPGGISHVLKPKNSPGLKYDLIIGTSENGSNVSTLDLARAPVTAGDDTRRLPHRILIVFGGLDGLETACKSDPRMLFLLNKKSKRKKKEPVEGGEDVDMEEVDEVKEPEPSLIFDHYINTCPDQGSRTIRTEEAIFISLASMMPRVSSLFTDWASWA